MLRRVSFLATSSLLALALLVPAGASAETPTLNASAFGAPATVSAGGTGAIALAIHNGDKSTVSQLFLRNITVTIGTFVKAVPSQGTCTGDLCTLGQLKPNKDATVFVVFTAPASGDVTASGLFETTGPAGTGDNSHGDAWPVSGSATVSEDAQDFSGRFIDVDGNLIVENFQTVSDTNPQATTVVAPKALIGVSVEDGVFIDPVCDPTKFDCADIEANFFGEASIINVAQGGTFTDGFKIIITFDGSEIVGANQNTLTIYHSYTGGAEIIDSKCTFAPNATTPKSMPCLTVTKGDGKDLVATIWTTHNGVMHGLG